jgi:hypothetical protein
MSLPLVLAGPIVRRVEARLASVWVALSAPSNVQLELFDGRLEAGSGSPLFRGVPVPALRAGEHLYFAVATVDLENSPSVLLPGHIYSYNLRFDASQDLRSLKLLEDRTEKEENGKLIVKGHAALGYDQGFLPSFVMPPTELTDLCLIHGSCRRPESDTPDAMVWIDDFIRSAIRNDSAAPIRRPHQLFLTGDQIYADDVASSMLYMIGKRCAEGIVGIEKIPVKFPLAEKNPSVDLKNFPVLMRKNFTISEARFTSADGANHLISFAEFCVMYLFVWSNELWPDTLPTLTQMLEFPAAPLPIWALHTGLGDSTGEGLKDEFLGKLHDAMCKKHGEKYHEKRRVMRTFRTGLPKVRRALANVATYMIFDDHEITDDWNLSVTWVDRVNTSPSGSAIVRNGLLAYALCQGWGNDPKKFTTDVKESTEGKKPTRQAELLSKIPLLFPSGMDGPDHKSAAEAEELLGLTGKKPPNVVTWNYTVPGPRHTVVALDVRTRRGRTQRLAAPENLSSESLAEQLPPGPLGSGSEVLVVLSSLTVLGPPVIDAVLGPGSYKVYDLKAHGNKADMPGLDPDAIEAWPNNPIAFERVLDRLSTYPQVVVLSGDVHFATSVEMSYFRKGAPAPSRIAQLTSSALKNLFKEEARRTGQYFAFLQHVIAAEIDVARIAWKKPAADLLNIPPGANVVPRLRELLKATPVLLPSHGWPSGTQQDPARPPDWAWHVHIPNDDRPDLKRPEGVRPTQPLVPANPNADIKFDLEGYRRVAVRHTAQLNNINYDRQIVFASNLGVITFDRTAGKLKVVQDLYALHQPPFDQQPEPYTRHEISLSADPAEKQPTVGGA